MKKDERLIVDAFHELYYLDLDRTWRNTFYKGHSILKCPLDLWIYSEIIWETKPEVIVETGTAHGGSALWFADQMRLYTDSPDVVTIDTEDRLPYYENRPRDEAVGYQLGDSTNLVTIMSVRDWVGKRRAMVVLDSAHTKDHVMAELDAYAPLVPSGGYLIVEDGNVHGHPVLPTHAPGPYEAVQAWLPDHRDEFEIDRSREKFMMTFNPMGYLKRR